MRPNRENGTKVLGITGGVGAGKSEILAYLKEAYGADVIELDALGHELLDGDETVRDAVRALFGDGIEKADGSFERSAIAERIYADPEKKRLLEEILHPAIKKNVLARIGKDRKESCALCVLEAALLLEDGYDTICDEIWYIYASTKKRERRLVEQRGYPREKIRSIQKAQKSEVGFRLGCDALIDNDRDLSFTKEQIDRRMKE